MAPTSHIAMRRVQKEHPQDPAEAGLSEQWQASMASTAWLYVLGQLSQRLQRQLICGHLLAEPFPALCSSRVSSPGSSFLGLSRILVDAFLSTLLRFSAAFVLRFWTLASAASAAHPNS